MLPLNICHILEVVSLTLECLTCFVLFFYFFASYFKHWVFLAHNHVNFSKQILPITFWKHIPGCFFNLGFSGSKYDPNGFIGSNVQIGIELHCELESHLQLIYVLIQSSWCKGSFHVQRESWSDFTVWGVSCPAPCATTLQEKPVRCAQAIQYLMGVRLAKHAIKNHKVCSHYLEYSS